MKKRKALALSPVLFLAAFAASAPVPERSAREALMDEIERQIQLPAGAHRLDEYGRYYAFAGKRRVEAVYMLPPEPETPDPRPADWGCEEVLLNGKDLATREVPCPPEPDLSRYLKAGQRRWVADREALPFIADGGCTVVHVDFDLKTRKVEHVGCNGHA